MKRFFVSLEHDHSLITAERMERTKNGSIRFLRGKVVVAEFAAWDYWIELDQPERVLH